MLVTGLALCWVFNIKSVENRCFKIQGSLDESSTEVSLVEYKFNQSPML